MRVCKKCFQTKAETDFFYRNKGTGQLHTQCKTCYTLQRKNTYTAHYQKYKEAYQARAKERRFRLRQEYRDNMQIFLQDKQCSDCGEDDIVVLELDHLDPQAKKFDVSQAVKLGYSWPEVVEELKKCEVVCANCHKRRTAKQFKWYKFGGTDRI